MDDDDYVETSDVEELMAEQLDRTRRLSLDRTSCRTPPRKRIKLSHDFGRHVSVEGAGGSMASSPILATLSTVLEPQGIPNNNNMGSRVHSPGFSQVPNASQDPLLLCSPVQFGSQRLPSSGRAERPLNHNNDATTSTTPPNTPPHFLYPCISPSLRRSSSQAQVPPMSTYPGPPSPPLRHRISSSLPPSSPSQLYFPSSPTEEGAQPHSPSNDSISPSPFSQPPVQSQSSSTSVIPAPSLSPPPASPLPSVSIPQRVSNPDPPEIPPDLMNEQRYRLRHRNISQLKPFTADRVRYEAQLKGIPDAIVKIKSIHRSAGSQVGSDEEESQGNNFIDEAGPDPEEERFWKEQERRQKKGKENVPEQPKKPTVEHPGILRDDISSQEEDDEVMRDARRLARAEKLKKKQEKAAQSKVKSKSRPQSFPKPAAPTVLGVPSDYFNQYDDDDDNNNDFGFDNRDEGPTYADQFDMQVDPPCTPLPSLPHPEPQREDPEDNDDDVASNHLESDTGVEMDDIPQEPNLPGANLKILKRMYPTFMLPAILQSTNSINSKNRREKSIDAENSNDPLRPGQSRVRRTENLKDIRHIKGDSESSDDEPAINKDVVDLTDSDSDVVSVRHRSRSPPTRRRLHKGKKPLVVNLLQEVSESDYVSDEELEMEMLYQTSGANARHTQTVFRETSLIDYMLNRSAQLGSKKGSKGQRRHKTPGAKGDGSRFKLDITTSGARREKQTKLSFASHGTEKGGYRPRDGPSASHAKSKIRDSRDPGTSRYRSDDEETGFADVADISMHQGWKERQRMRKAREKAKGVYCFGDGNRHVDAGRGRAAFITVDLEDEDFRRGLIPKSNSATIIHPRHPLSWPRLVNLEPELHSTDNRSHSPVQGPKSSQTRPAKPQSRLPIRTDFKLPAMPVVKSFGTNSYTGSGYLHDLLSTLSGTRTPPTPISHTFQNFDLSSSMSISEFCALIPNIFDSYLEFVGELPNPDTNNLCNSWQKFGHVLHHYCTAFMGTAEQTSLTELYDCINLQLLRIVEHFKTVTLESVDIPLLQLYWFSLELSLRISARNGLLPSVSGTSKDLVSYLITLLFQFGFKDIINGLRKESTSEGSPPWYSAAEIWVCLIHVLDPRRVAVSQPKAHPFWEPVKTQINILIPNVGLQASEDFWSIIFGLCSLSQFNDYGMATSQPRLPACWELAIAALKKVELEPVSDKFNPSKGKTHDAYIGLLISRCNHLRERWQWKSATFEFLNVLSVIFKSRRFANLLHERGGIPAFFRSRSWESFLTYDPRDTSFIHFLKMTGHAFYDSFNPSTGKPSLNPKKLTSMFLSVSSFSFDKSSSSNPRAMDPLYNRIYSAAVAVHLDPSDYDSRMAQVRKYVSFADVDDSVRIAVIQRLVAWGVMMINDKVSISGITTWAAEIADVLGNELKAIKAPTDEDSAEVKGKRVRLVLVSSLLVGALRQIAESYLSTSSYPEPSLLGCLKSIRASWLWRKGNAPTEFMALHNMFFEARIAALPPPERPPKPVRRKPAEAESQDYDADFPEINWDAIDFLDTPKDLSTHVVQKPAHEDKDAELRKILDSSYRLRLTEFISEVLKREVPARDFEDEAIASDAWMKSLVSITSVEGGDQKWKNVHSYLVTALKHSPRSIWRSRIALGFYYYVLLLEPTAYCNADLKEDFIAKFLDSLVSSHARLESRYVALLLSVDGLQHPLFQDMDCLPEPCESNGDYNFKDTFEDLRLPIMRVVLQNTQRLLTKTNEDPESILVSAKCLGYCKDMLSTLRMNQLAITSTGNKELIQSYDMFCANVVDACFEFSEIRTQVDKFWVDWRRDLAAASNGL